MPLNLEQAIIKTVIYADIFNYPLTIEEADKWLIGVKGNQSEVSKTVRSLISSKKIELKGSYIYLPGRSGLIGIRSRKREWSKEKMDKLGKILPILKRVPFVQMVGVTGTLSMENANNNDDIDLLIITKKKRLWLTRLIITVLLELKGVRRHPHTNKAKDKICINMFLDEDHLILLTPERDIFSAHELMQMKPILEKDAAYSRFIASNRWVEKYLPNIFAERVEWANKSKLEYKRKILKRTNSVVIWLVDCLELLLEIIQLWYMRSRRTNEVILNGYVRFHPQDVRSRILSEYKSRLLT